MPVARQRKPSAVRRSQRRRRRSHAAAWPAGDPVRLVREIKSGFAFARLESFHEASGLPWGRIAHLTGIPQRTLSRRQREGRLAPDESDRLVRAVRLFQLAVDLFEGDAPAARRWLETPQRALSGAVPLDLASTGVGARCVEDLITRLEHGVFP